MHKQRFKRKIHEAAMINTHIHNLKQVHFNLSCWTDGLTFEFIKLWYPGKFTVQSMAARCQAQHRTEQAHIIIALSKNKVPNYIWYHWSGTIKGTDAVPSVVGIYLYY